MWRYANHCAYISNRYADTFVDAHYSIKHVIRATVGLGVWVNHVTVFV